MRRPLDLRGQRFGRLYALRHVEVPGKSGRYWYCLCSCGGRKVVLASRLTGRNTRSCGCLRRERGRELARKRWRTPCEECGMRDCLCAGLSRGALG